MPRGIKSSPEFRAQACRQVLEFSRPRRSAGRHLPKLSKSTYDLFHEQVLQRLVESGQYTSREFRRCLRANGRLRTSMGQVGCAYDNAVAESFFASLKKELVHCTTFPTRARAVEAVANYIEVFYNHRRHHQSLGYQTPAACRAAYTTNKTAA